jgi:hypothetical protein
MPSFHAKPYCWCKLKYSQDELKNMGTIKCPGCKLEITAQDVCEPVQFVDLISLIKAAGSKQNSLFEGIR